LFPPFALENEALRYGKDNFHMDDTVSQKKLEIKHAGQAIECGTLAILLNAVVQQPVLIMPLQRAVSNGAQAMRQWFVHLTTQPYIRNGPVYYATFLAAEAIGIGQSVGLTYPYRFIEAAALARGNELQEELTLCLSQIVTQSPRVSGIIMPARYRLPDVWVWSARSQAEQIVLRDQHWTVVSH
jgi:hypothetical protein